MKRLFCCFFTNEPLSANGQSAAIFLFRIFAGLMMLPYGFGKIQDFDALKTDFFGDPIGIGMLPSLVLTIFAQVVCASALTVGLFTRTSAFILALNMLVALRYHWYDSWATVSLPAVFLAMYCLLLLLGGGRYSVDSLLFNRNKK